MSIKYSYKIPYYGSMIVLGLVVIAIVAQYFGWFGPQRSFTKGNLAYLEQQRDVAEGSLQTIPGVIRVGPYRALWQQRYEFLGQPTTLSFWLYNFTYDDTKRFFHEIASKGTKIQGIMESEQYAAKDNQIKTLMDGFADNSNVRIIPDDRLGVNFQHAKTFVTPNGAIIQTANMTYSSFSKNREVFFMTTDTGVVSSLQQLFDRDWQGLPTAMDALHPNLIVCPTNCRSRIESLLQSAQDSIVMYQQYIADDDIQRILTAKQKEGVTIRMILGDYGDKSNKNESDERFYVSLGSAVKKQGDPYVHAKAILVDNQFLLVGSMNMSDTSLDKNREIGILLLDPYQITTFMRTFEKDWAKK